MVRVQYTALGGFRVLKNTSEAPYTTKVNYRVHTSRGGTTPSEIAEWHAHDLGPYYCQCKVGKGEAAS